MCYFDEIDPIGEEKARTCLNCGNPTDSAYCSTFCKMEDNFDRDE